MVKKILKEMKWDALFTGVLYIILGVMSLALPETMEKILGYMIGVVLIVGGAVSMISYLLRDAHQNYYHNDFLHGLIGIAAGILVLVKMDTIVSLISFLLGTLVLVSGCSKLQDVIDMKRLECGNWIAMLIIAAVNVGFGILLICNPFSDMLLLFRLLGIGLILSGLIDCVSTFYFADRIRRYLDSLTAVDSTFAEVTVEDMARKSALVRKGTPARESAPTQEGTPARGNVPERGSTPEREGTLARENVPAMESTPAQEGTPAMESTPAQEGTPAESETTAKEEIPAEWGTLSKQETPSEKVTQTETGVQQETEGQQEAP